MGDLEAIQFDLKRYKTELAEFYDQIIKKDQLKERDHILPFFYKRKHLLASIASYNPRVSKFDKVANEFGLFGKFRADAVAGDSSNQTYCFIEFEDANSKSVFTKQKEPKKPKKQTERKTPEWSARLKNGLMQLTDWFWTLDENKNTSDFNYAFGSGKISYVGLLVIGRDKFISEQREQDRWFWLQENLLINSKRVICITYDQLYKDLRNRLDMYHLEDIPITVDETGNPKSTKI